MKNIKNSLNKAGVVTATALVLGTTVSSPAVAQNEEVPSAKPTIKVAPQKISPVSTEPALITVENSDNGVAKLVNNVSSKNAAKLKEAERLEAQRVAEEKAKEAERLEAERVALEKAIEEEKAKEAERLAEEARAEAERAKEAQRVAEEAERLEAEKAEAGTEEEVAVEASVEATVAPAQEAETVEVAEEVSQPVAQSTVIETQNFTQNSVAEQTVTAPVVGAQKSSEQKTQTKATEKVSNTTASSRGLAIANAAKAQIGVTQDCTMLATNSLKAVGINFHDWPVGYLSLGKTIPASEAKPGDLIYYATNGMGGSHIAVYIGDGKAIHGGWNGYTTAEFSANLPSASQPIYISMQ